MKKNKFTATKLQRSRALVIMAVFLVSVFSLSVLPGLVQAAAQISSRSITMSDSGASSGNTAVNGSTIGTGLTVTYSAKFNVATTGNVQGIVIAFCDSTPFMGDTCSAITGFSATATPTVGNLQGISATWAAAAGTGGGGAANHVVTLTNASGGSISAGTTVGFSLTGFTNPSTTNHSFYARIMTYATVAVANAYTDTVPGAYVDYGGIALSTANVISISAKVQESLTFCISGVAPTANCVGITTASVVLGHGTNTTLDSSVVDYAAAYSQSSTNANGGLIIRMVNSNVCGGLSRLPIGSQTSTTGCDIPPINNNSASLPTAATVLAAGTADFGVNVSNGVVVGTGSGSITASSIYNNTGLPTNTTYVGMNMTASTTNPGVTSTYGDMVASSTGPVNNLNNTYTFAATASNLTPAGIYKANVALIATGTY